MMARFQVVDRMAVDAILEHVPHVVRQWDIMSTEMRVFCGHCKAKGLMEDALDFARKHSGCVHPADVDTRWIELAAR